MDWNLLKEAGVAIVSLAVLYGLARHFIKSADNKDKRMEYLTEKFIITVQNHINHGSNVIQGNTNALDKNTETIKELKEVIKDKL